MTVIHGIIFVLGAVMALQLSNVAAQDVDACYSADNAPVNGSAQYIDDVDLPLESADVANYLELCLDLNVKEQSVRDIVRKTSDLCADNPIDSGSTKCSERLTRYGYSEERKACVPFTYTGCGGNDNNFESLDECRNTCEDPCTQPMDSGSSTETHESKDGEKETVECGRKAGVFYYYNAATGTCVEMRYLGCGGNKNRFETREECMGVCGSTTATVDPVVSSVDSTSLSLTRGKRQTQEQNDQDSQQYCAEFEKNFPDTVSIIKSLDLTSSPDTEQALIGELEAQIAEPNTTSVAQRKRRALLGLLTRPLRHTSVKIYTGSNCRRIEVTIRIKCLKALSNRPTDAQAARMCELVKQGIKKYWEVDIQGTNGYQVTVNVVERWLLSKKVMLQYFTSSPSNPNNLRSFNLGFVWLPMWMKYAGFNSGSAEDQAFMETAAHEFGHDVLKAQGGVIWSWTHEGTSTLFQNTHAGTPALPSPPADINLMWYYNGGDSTDYYDRVKASQSQITALVNYATFRLTIPWCFGEIGAPCLTNSHCNPPGICSWFRCVLCNSDSMCPSNQYCKGLANPFIVNHCANKKPNGALCIRDGMCASGHCDGGQCVVCEIDSHCPSGHYCKNNNLPLVLNVCEPKKPNGALCIQDRQCASGMCDGGLCVPCEQDSHCPPGQWCKNKNLPLVMNVCVSKLSNGAWCTSDSQCASGMCDGLRCVECEQHHHCASNQYCKNKDLPLILNKCTNKKCTGFCTSDVQCLSGKCRLWLLSCKKC